MPNEDKSFDDLLSNGKTFTVRGVKFHVRDLAPEDVFSDSEVKTPENSEDVWAYTDAAILKFIPDSEHEAWTKLRADRENPVTIRQMNAAIAWLWEEATGHPLPQPAASEVGPGKTVTSSTAKSR